MGIKRLSEIPVWTADHANDPDSSVPVGSLQAREKVTLTRCVIDRQDAASLARARFVVEFADEVGSEGEPIRAWRDRPLEVRASASTPGEAVTLMSLELETRRTELLNQTVITAYQPTSLDWFDWASFKRVKRRSRGENDALVRSLMSAYNEESANKDAAMWAALRQLATDPFGSEDYYYARLGFMRTDGLALTAFDPGNPLSSLHEDTKANRRPGGGVSLTFGVCANFEEMRDMLLAAPLLNKTLRRATDGVIVTHDGEEFPLTATAQSLAGAVCQAAIVKALSGPNEDYAKRLRSTRDETQKHGRPAVLATWIFLEEMRNLAKRTSGEPSVFLRPLSEFN
jgi:hypothetical protein